MDVVVYQRESARLRGEGVRNPAQAGEDVTIIRHGRSLGSDGRAGQDQARRSASAIWPGVESAKTLASCRRTDTTPSMMS
jgi:hypothetical protein